MSQTETPCAVVFRGSKRLCDEYSLLLEARSIDHEVLKSGDAWSLCVPPHLLQQAYEEISRYSAERSLPQPTPEPAILPHEGAAVGIFFYVLILLAVAFAAGAQLFGADWLALGSLDANVDPSHRKPEQKSQRMSQDIHMRAARTQEGEQTDPRDQRCPAIPQAFAQGQPLPPCHA